MRYPPRSRASEKPSAATARRRRAARSLSVAIALVVIVGCGSDGSTTADTEPASATVASTASTSAGPSTAEATDTEATEWFIKEIGVAGVPGSSFFREPEHRFIRFHFAKKTGTLDAAGEKLERVKQGR